MDAGDNPRFSFSRGTITYSILSYPTMDVDKPHLSQAEVINSFEIAFGKWAAISNFNFQRMEGEAANIHIYFGEFASIFAKYPNIPTPNYGSLELAYTAVPSGLGENNEPPIVMVFRNDRHWTNYSQEHFGIKAPGMALLELVNRVGELIHSADLVTIAAHEAGHALGLGHSTDNTALMYKDVVLWSSTLMYYMSSNPIPDVDAQRLADRYASLEPPPGNFEWSPTVTLSLAQLTPRTTL